MRPCCCGTCITFAALASVAAAGTLNFQNVTASRVVSTVAESSSNEKALDAGDFDNDGDLDVVIADAYSDFGSRRNKLYRNDGGVFLEVSGPPVIPGFSNAYVSRAGFLRDYDGDGWPDIVIINDGQSWPNKMYLNKQVDGAFSHFEEISAPGPLTRANHAESFDADMDGDLDIFVANGVGAPQDFLLLNDGSGSFVDATASNVPPDTQSGLDAAAADFNGDGKPDLLVSGYASAQDKIYYNDLSGFNSSGPGDFRYGPGGLSGVEFLGVSSGGETADEPGDFDGDGRIDFYAGDRVSFNGDRVLHNTGNAPNGMAMFEELAASTLPPSTQRISRKETVADLNGDGRPDVVVMIEEQSNSRPSILRNVSVGGTTAFVDWTPASAFPSGNAHKGWNAIVFDSNGDGDPDIFLGGWSGDHLFENAPPVEVGAPDINGVLPPLFNGDAVAVSGSAGAGDTDTYDTAESINGYIAAVLNGPDDYLVEVRDAGGNLLGASDRGGAGVEEALQVNAAGPVMVSVTILDCAASPGDVSGDCAIDVVDLLALLSAWGPNPRNPADMDGNGIVDVVDFLALLAAWGPVTHPYLLELLARQ